MIKKNALHAKFKVILSEETIIKLFININP